MDLHPTSLFLVPLILLSGCIEIYEDAGYWIDKSRCNVRVGILSELHLASSHPDMTFVKALRYFAEREVDAVVIAGGVTRNGSLAQRRGVKAAWDKVFPNGRVKLIVVTGEDEGEKVYEDLSGATFSPSFVREVKGYTFIGANWEDATGVDVLALKPLLTQVGREKPFFYVQNVVPYGTCCPDKGRVDVFDSGKISYMLSKFPNAVAICGRSHTPLTDESAFWRGDFTCLNAGTFSCAMLRGQDAMFREMKQGVRHGLVMSVYDASIVFERIDFGREAKDRRGSGVYVEKLGADWVLPLPAKPSPRPATAAPQFWDDTRLMVFPSADVVSVRFPPVLAKHTGVRAQAYEVLAKTADGGEISSWTTTSPGFCSSEENETKPVTVNFSREGLPKGKVRFEVTPMDAFGRRGRSIFGEVEL